VLVIFGVAALDHVHPRGMAEYLVRTDARTGAFGSSWLLVTFK
jgi:hypothetical protein